MSKTLPLGPNGTWKTGQRVPVSGTYVDQNGVVSHHEEHSTFPPEIGFGRTRGVAFRRLAFHAAATA